MTSSRILTLTESNIDSVVSQTAIVLLSGGVVAVPTDTVYGLAALAHDVEAVKMLYKVKERRESKPVAISVSDVEEIYK